MSKTSRATILASLTLGLLILSSLIVVQDVTVVPKEGPAFKKRNYLFLWSNRPDYPPGEVYEWTEHLSYFGGLVPSKLSKRIINGYIPPPQETIPSAP